MPSTTQLSRTSKHWLMFGGIIGAGLLLSCLVTFVVRHPLDAGALVLLVALVFQQKPSPFDATCEALRFVYNPIADELRNFWLPLVVVFGFIFAIGQMWYHGTGRGIAVLGMIYLGDRVAAWSIEQHRHWLGARRYARERARTETVIVECQVEEGL